MTGKERMLAALQREAPDRLPVTIHQWQACHLQQFMGGVDQVEAFRATGLDASVTPWVGGIVPSDRWMASVEQVGEQDGQTLRRHRVRTAAGDLTWTTASNAYTTFIVEHPVKQIEQLEVFLDHWPAATLDRAELARWYDRTGDLGIVRGFVRSWAQPGVWQELCELAGTEQAIYWAMDHPQAVHDFLQRLTAIKVDYVHREMAGARYDLIEHGGGAASSTVISPAMFETFCLPYDRQVIDALHGIGLPVVYHTCGGMMALLEKIPLNGCDASETLSPPGVGGDIAERWQRERVKQVLGSRVALIGGIDQGNILTEGTPRQVEQAVGACFESFGPGGGYICSASDHFFHAPVENLRAMARAARDCRY